MYETSIRRPTKNCKIKEDSEAYERVIKGVNLIKV
jgi:hypothetical protein